jgi:hypothetical protein
MMVKEDSSVDSIIEAIIEHEQELEKLRSYLVTRAKLLGYTERQYDALLKLGVEGIEFLSGPQAGDVITEEWLAKRQDIVQRAQRLIADVQGNQ